MSETLRRVQTLVYAQDYLISDHAFEEMLPDAILPSEAIGGISAAIARRLPDRFRGPSVLALQFDTNGRALQLVWAVPARVRRPAALVTAYRPNPRLWDSDFKRRERR